MKCGKPVRKEQEYCVQCTEERRFFTEGRSILIYDDMMRESIIKFKYEGRRGYGDFYVKLMCSFGMRDILRWSPDLILPVPLHKRKLRNRGFNQAEYLAQGISRKFGIPMAADVLKKEKNTKSQKKLDAKGRKRNLKKVFQVYENLNGLKILVIDDVYTTGSTMDEIASVLTSKGAKKVFFLTICTGYN